MADVNNKDSSPEAISGHLFSVVSAIARSRSD